MNNFLLSTYYIIIMNKHSSVLREIGMLINLHRIKLSGFLESSTCYDPACLLTEVQDTDMYRECAILYGRVRSCIRTYVHV